MLQHVLPKHKNVRLQNHSTVITLKKLNVDRIIFITPNIQFIKCLILKNLPGKDFLCHLSQWLTALSLRHLMFLRQFEKSDGSFGPSLQKNSYKDTSTSPPCTRRGSLQLSMNSRLKRCEPSI